MANITTPTTTGVAMRLPLPIVARLTVDGRNHRKNIPLTDAQTDASIKCTVGHTIDGGNKLTATPCATCGVARLTEPDPFTPSQMAAYIIAMAYGVSDGFVPSSKTNHTSQSKTDAEIRAERKQRRDARKQRTTDALAKLAQSLVAPTKP